MDSGLRLPGRGWGVVRGGGLVIVSGAQRYLHQLQPVAPLVVLLPCRVQLRVGAIELLELVGCLGDDLGAASSLVMTIGQSPLRPRVQCSVSSIKPFIISSHPVKIQHTLAVRCPHSRV